MIGCNADAHGEEAARCAGIMNFQVFHGAPDGLGHLSGAPGLGIGQQQREFFATQPCGHVKRTPQRAPEGLRHQLQTAVSRRVAEVIIVPFELIDIDHEQRDGQRLAPGAPPFCLKRAPEGASVRELGERVRERQMLQLKIEPGHAAENLY